MTQADDFIGQRERRIENIKKLRKLGIDPYPAQSRKDHENKYVIDHFQDLQGHEVTLAGRLVSFRDHGKLKFGDILDQSGKIQIALKQDTLLGDLKSAFLPWEHLNLLDEGDFIQVTGKIDKTQQGQITLFVNHLKLLAKSLRPLPSKIEEKEYQFRRRYLDLIVNRHHMDVFLRKAKFWQVQREFMRQKGFIEVETPVLEHVTGGADARPFVTHHNDLGQDFYLRISTELYQKRLVGAGLEKVYTLGPNFRNEGMSDEHYQEYYQLEWYWAYADYRDNMKLVRELFIDVAKKVYGRTKFTARGHTFDLEDEWKEIDYATAIREKFGLDIFQASDLEMLEVVKKNGLELEGALNKNRLIDNLWKIIRKDVAGPAYLIHVPKFLSPLAKSDPKNPELTERFQIILAGSELGNGYSEINDPLDQLERFMEQQALREQGDEEAQMLDIDFVEMLEWGMPPTSGYGHSERLFWFFEDATPRETILFPQLRRETESLTLKIYPQVFKKQAKKILMDSMYNQISSRIDQKVRDQAHKLVDEKIQNKNLVKHCLAVEAAMRGLAQYFGEDASVWGLAGLLHDADWEFHRDRPDLHTKETIKWMKEKNINDQEVIEAILSHNYEHNGERPPKSRLEWALYTCDELTGLIVACALVMPSKKIDEVTTQSVLKKFNTPSFAAAVNRNQIRMCEEKLGLNLEDFIAIILNSMKNVSSAIGL